jgi:hypothetical protein
MKLGVPPINLAGKSRIMRYLSGNMQLKSHNATDYPANFSEYIKYQWFQFGTEIAK